MEQIAIATKSTLVLACSTDPGTVPNVIGQEVKTFHTLMGEKHMSDFDEAWKNATEEERTVFIREKFKEDPLGFYETMVMAHGEEVVLAFLEERPQVREYVLKCIKDGKNWQ